MSDLLNQIGSPNFRLGTEASTNRPCWLSDNHLAVHMAILGGSGSGKSKLIELLLRQFMVERRGFCFIDPDRDTAEDLLAFAAALKAEGDDEIWRKVHYVEPSYEMVFGFDPFKFRPMKPISGVEEKNAYRAWLHTKVDSIAELFQRKQGDAGFEGMPRLKRVLTNVLTAVGTAIDMNGKHLPLADALVLLDIYHRRHEEVFRRVAPGLDRDIVADFEILHGFRRVQDLRTETESTINRLRTFLSPLVKGIFCDTVNTIDFFNIVQRSDFLIVNLRETDYFSADQGNTIGSLFIHEIISTAQNTPRGLRRDFALVVDEAPEFIGADIQRALRRMRKYRLRLVLCAQNLTSFQKGDLDLGPTVLSKCGSIVCFQQKLKEDLEILAPVL